MPRRQGFPQAQFDSAFLSDPKHRRLAVRLASRGASFTDEDIGDILALAGVGLWAIAIAHAWANDDPVVDDVVSDERQFIVEELVRSGLLVEVDGSTTIPPDAFARWTDVARKARNSARDRSARHREVLRTSENSAEVPDSLVEEVEVEVEKESNGSLVRTENQPREVNGSKRTGFARIGTIIEGGTIP